MTPLPKAITNRSAAIVVLGDFNPVILQPMWFDRTGLLDTDEAKSASVQAITREVCIFEASWFRLQCLTDRFQVSTEDATRLPDLRDLSTNVFRILEHTPIRAFGFNASADTPLPSEAAWHRFGHECAPKALWTKHLDNPGMRSLTIEGQRRHSSAAYVRIKVEPSARVDHGVHFQLNEHYAIDDVDSPFDRIRRYIEVGQASFLPFQTYADSVVTELVSTYFSDGELQRADRNP